MGFSTTSRNNTRSVQSNRRLLPPNRKPNPQSRISRPVQSTRPPAGLPQQLSAPLSLPNINQPISLPPTQMQVTAPPVTQPVAQSNSLFAPPTPLPQPSFTPISLPPPQPAISPIFEQPQTQQPAINPVFEQPQTQQPAINPVFEQPQMQQPVQQPAFEQPQMQQPVFEQPQPVQQPIAPEQIQEQTQPAITPDIYGGLTPGEALGGGFTMQQPMNKMNETQYVDFNGNPANPMSMIPMMTKEEYDAQQIAGPIMPSFMGAGMKY